ncbi:MAG TPA: sulfotransferase [Solirubrobacteraceae bacterium]|nr:sulfotransferase [Solirubrobacteraceae bacterium]
MTASPEAPSAALEPSQRIPDFYIVGHPKCGTTALYEMLRDHPQIFMPELKEPWFFASDMRPRFQPPRSAPPFETIEEYRALFSGAAPGQRIGEASSAYLLSHTAAAQIAEARPDARIIAILREPASFLRSLHIQLLRTHVEGERSFRRAIELEPERRAGRKIPRRSHRPQLLMYSDHVRYAEQLRRYHEAFGPEQVLVLIYDDFRADNERTVRTVRRFLGVDEAPPVRSTDANSTTVMMRSQQMDELLNVISVGRGPVSRGVKAVLKALTPDALRKRAMFATQRHLVMGKPEPLDEELMSELRHRFRGEVEAIGEYLDRDLVALWGYDRRG